MKDDPSVWVQTALGVVAIAVSIAFFLLDRRTRSLGFAVLSNRAVISKPLPDLDVFYDGRTVDDPHLLVCRVANGGVSAIDPSHYEQPISLHVHDARILSAEVTHSRPSSFRPRISQEGDREAVLEKCLMNPKDMVEIQMLVEGRPTSVDAQGRISGVSNIKRESLP